MRRVFTAVLWLATSGCQPLDEQPVALVRLPVCDGEALRPDRWRVRIISVEGVELRAFDAGGFPSDVRLPRTPPVRVRVEALSRSGEVIGSGSSRTIDVGREAAPAAELSVLPRGRFVKHCQTLAEPRRGHTITATLDGRLFVAGGFGVGDVASADFELIGATEPSERGALSSTTRDGKTLTQARGFHSATRAPSGQIMLIGGESQEQRRNAANTSAFDVDLRATGVALTTARSRHLSVLTSSGLLSLGGVTWTATGPEPERSVTEFDLSTGRELRRGTLAGLCLEAALAAGNTQALVAGGHTLGVSCAGAALVAFDGSVSAFDLDVARTEATAVSVGASFVVSSGRGADGRALESATRVEPDGTVRPGPRVVPRRQGCGVTLLDGRGLLVGGLDEADLPVATAELFSADGSVERVEGPPVWQTACARLDDGSVVVAGGRSTGQRPITTLWTFTP